MKKKQILSMIICISMIFMLCSCSGTKPTHNPQMKHHLKRVQVFKQTKIRILKKSKHNLNPKMKHITQKVRMTIQKAIRI